MAVFALVVDAGSFTKAGRRLGIAKSAVSRYVSELEDEVGHELLLRTTRKLVLTDAGERFYVDCARLIEAATDSFDSIEPESLLLGSLHLGATQSFGRHVLLPAVNTFLAQHPKLSIQMSLNDRIVDLVTQGIDLSFRIGSPGTSPSYVFRKIAVTRFELFASRGFLADHEFESVEALEAVPWMLSSLGPQPDRWTLTRGSRKVTLRPGSQLLSDSPPIAQGAAELGMGVVGLPDFMRPSGGVLVRLFEDWVVEPQLDIYAVYPRRRFVSPRVRGFLEHLEEYLTGV